ncbi:MAG: asparaginase [Acidobacteria bacterium]|jgi:L-asparaginase II|nr:asparaginase [Acidobacteriota bacterium]
MKSEILAKVIRGEIVESIHRGHLIVADGDSKTIASLGNPEIITFFRSSAKPFQAFPFLTSGAASAFDFLEKEIALTCGSHSGEKIHTETVEKMLRKIGLSESDLQCGTQLPFHKETAEKMIRAGEKPTQLHNNCSGKHAAMLALARHIGADAQTYEHLENPIQQKILETVSQFTDIPKNEIKIGIDGCAAPNFALPVSAMAKSFARLVFPPSFFDKQWREACRCIVSAMINYPEMIGGTERLDTIIMQTLRGKIISKVGAEGVYVAGILPSPKWKKGLGIAFKIEDGEDRRARPVVAIELLRQLGILDGETLKQFSPITIENRRGDIIGEIQASFNLNL